MKYYTATIAQVLAMHAGDAIPFFCKTGTVPVEVGDLVGFIAEVDGVGTAPLPRIVTAVTTLADCPALKKGWVAISTRAVHRAEMEPGPVVPPRQVRKPSEREQMAHRDGSAAKAAGRNSTTNPHNVRNLRAAWAKGWINFPL